MKKYLIIVALVLLIALLSAQDDKKVQNVDEGKELGSSSFEPMSIEEILENKNELYLVRLTGRLKLTEEQRESIRPIALERMKLMDKMMREKEKNGELSRDYMNTIIVESRKLMNQINALLTEEQRYSFKEMQKENLKKIREDKKNKQ